MLRACIGQMKPWNSYSKIIELSYKPAVFRHSLRSCSNTQNSGIEPLSGLPYKDKDKGQLIYSGPIAKLIKGVKLFSLSTSIMGLTLQPLIFMNAKSMALMSTIAVGGIVNFFIFVTPVLIHFICKKYVIVCYHDQETGQFTATTYTFFLRRKDIKFTAEDCYVPDVPGMFTTLKAKGVPLFMEQNMFFSKEAFVSMMGYDKPIDWQLPESVLNKNNNKQSDKKE